MDDEKKSGNLKPIRTTEEARQKGAEGGRKSAEARRARKTFREALEAVLKGKVPDPDDPERKDTAQALLVAKLVERAMHDNEAFKIVRDTVGEKPAERVSATVDNESKEMLKSYLDSLKG